jgi:hypothetical protein
MRSSVRFSVREYLIAHGHSPRGFGLWAFRMQTAKGAEVASQCAGWNHELYLVSGRFGDAKAAAGREARRVGATVVFVGS